MQTLNTVEEALQRFRHGLTVNTLEFLLTPGFDPVHWIGDTLLQRTLDRRMHDLFFHGSQEEVVFLSALVELSYKRHQVDAVRLADQWYEVLARGQFERATFLAQCFGFAGMCGHQLLSDRSVWSDENMLPWQYNAYVRKVQQCVQDSFDLASRIACRDQRFGTAAALLMHGNASDVYTYAIAHDLAGQAIQHSQPISLDLSDVPQTVPTWHDRDTSVEQAIAILTTELPDTLVLPKWQEKCAVELHPAAAHPSFSVGIGGGHIQLHRANVYQELLVELLSQGRWGDVRTLYRGLGWTGVFCHGQVVRDGRIVKQPGTLDADALFLLACLAIPAMNNAARHNRLGIAAALGQFVLFEDARREGISPIMLVASSCAHASTEDTTPIAGICFPFKPLAKHIHDRLTERSSVALATTTELYVNTRLRIHELLLAAQEKRVPIRLHL